MRFKTGLIIGLGTGYVLGAKAGRERYQQIVDATRAFMENPGVQRLTDEVNKTVSIGRERVAGAATRRVEQVSGTLAEQASKARTFVSGGESSDDKAAAAKKSGPKKAAEETSGTPPSTTTTGSTTRSGRTS